jgi:16S rRNA (adenine1518-N6/adenine1519-N6)-dimethyltransferase
MVQSEVADRLAASPGSRTYGSPSVKLQWVWRSF